MKKFWLVVTCAALLTGCAQKVYEAAPTPGEAAPKFGKVVSIKVTKAGEVFYNKKAVSVDELAGELNRLPKDDTAVCYDREEGDRDAPPVALEVIRKITDARLAVRLSREECP
ncbi:MAG: hypothetical protein LC802_12855 [Acidobacteria bacterium]|nr:hypothetical protein [Acidobacteriota bacterium]